MFFSSSIVQAGERTTPDIRIGIGHDTHRLAAGGPLRLGGIEIPHTHHAVGHSDADALLHALTDALLGAAALGDIGDWFPDTDPENRNRDSADMLGRALAAVVRAGFRVVNVDCVIMLQRPKLAPHKRALCDRLAQLLGIPANCVSVKAKTGEGLGPVGREEAIVTQCVVLLQRTSE